MFKGTKDKVDKSKLSDADKDKVKEDIDKCCGLITFLKKNVKTILGIVGIVTVGVIFCFIPGAQPFAVPILFITLVGIGLVLMLSDGSAAFVPEDKEKESNSSEVQTTPTSSTRTQEQEEDGQGGGAPAGSNASERSHHSETSSVAGPPGPGQPGPPGPSEIASSDVPPVPPSVFQGGRRLNPPPEPPVTAPPDVGTARRPYVRSGQRVLPPGNVADLQDELKALADKFHKAWEDRGKREEGGVVKPTGQDPQIYEKEPEPEFAGALTEEFEELLSKASSIIPQVTLHEPDGEENLVIDAMPGKYVRGSQKAPSKEDIVDLRGQLEKLASDFHDAWDKRAKAGVVKPTGQDSQSYVPVKELEPPLEEVSQVGFEYFLSRAKGIIAQIAPLELHNERAGGTFFSSKEKAPLPEDKRFDVDVETASTTSSGNGSLNDDLSYQREILDEVIDQLPLSMLEKQIFKLGRVTSKGKYKDHKAEDVTDGSIEAQKDISKKIREFLLKENPKCEVLEKADVDNHKKIWDKLQKMGLDMSS
ncbi:MAG: hypothetical protein B0D91_02195 [Oceanospirillales bacterium LUC14_002_19_P2]|nr:MAG: hypothetical protein B0D91_02195 [Oceanospirillales bacterium LUC14_002_19_P2]